MASVIPPARSRVARLLVYVKPYRWLIVGATLCGIVKYNVPVVFPWVLKDLIDRLVSPASLSLERLHLTMAGLLALYGLWAIATYCRFYWADLAGRRLMFDLRHAVYTHVQRLSLSFHARHHVGALGSRVIGDIATAQNVVGLAFTNTIMDASALFLVSGLLIALNWRLAVLSLAILPFYAVLNRWFQRRIRMTSRAAHDTLEEISGDVCERLGAVAMVQSFAREKAEERRFFTKHRTYLHQVLTNIRQNALAVSVIGLLTASAPVVVIWYGVIQVLHGRLTPGGLVAFYAYLGMLYTPLNRLTELNVLLANARSAIDRIFELLDASPDIVEPAGAQPLARVSGEIRFSNVSFAYQGAPPTLIGIDLLIPAGATVALVGPSGAGKSTLGKLLPRFYDVTAGAITIDGRDLRGLALASLRRHIAVVSQEAVVLSGTIRENLLYGKPGAAEDELVAAAHAAAAHDFIRALPEGYRTVLGEGGVTLSGGQRQRIALARAFLKDAPILILDEATSSLDSESEHLIQVALARLMRGRTTMVIAHRLSTIRTADLIAVLDRGRLVESGAHDALLARADSVYRRLYERQFGTRVHRADPAVNFVASSPTN